MILEIIMHNHQRKGMLELLLCRGINIVITEKILIAAAECEYNSPVLGFLLRQDNGANITENVFKAAALSGYEGNIQALSVYCSMAEIHVTWLRVARLHHFACNPDTAVVSVTEILEQGVRPDIPNNRGRTFLFDAAWFGNEPGVQTLLSAGANPNH